MNFNIAKLAMPESTQEIQHFLKNLDVRYISLVGKGANNRQLIYKSNAGDPTIDDMIKRELRIIKKDDDKRLVYCTVYAPDEADADGDAMTAAEIEKAAHGFLGAGRTDAVDKQHNEDPGEGLIVESFVLKGSDQRFEGEKEGAWVVAIKVLNDETWDEIKKGDITGVSLQGYANKDPVAKKSELGERISSLRDELELTNADLAAAANRDESTIGAIITGDITGAGIPDEVWEGLADVLEVSESSLRELAPEQKQKSGFWQKLEKVIKKVFGEVSGDKVEKKFTDSLNQQVFERAVDAFWNEAWDIVYQDITEDKQAALATLAGEFQEFIANVDSDITKQFNPMEKKKKKKSKEEPGADEQQSVIEKLDEMNEKLDSYSERIEKLEKSAPGRQSAEGQDGDESNIKKTKGLPIFGSLQNENEGGA